MLTYANVLEIGEKGERVGFRREAYPKIPAGHLGLRVLQDRWALLPVAEIDGPPELARIIVEIRQRELGETS